MNINPGGETKRKTDGQFLTTTETLFNKAGGQRTRSPNQVFPSLGRALMTKGQL